MNAVEWRFRHISGSYTIHMSASALINVCMPHTQSTCIMHHANITHSIYCISKHEHARVHAQHPSIIRSAFGMERSDRKGGGFFLHSIINLQCNLVLVLRCARAATQSHAAVSQTIDTTMRAGHATDDDHERTSLGEHTTETGNGH